MAFNPMEMGPLSIPQDTEILNELEITPEGDKIFEVIDIEKEREEEVSTDFYRNLAFDLSPSDLQGLAAEILDEIQIDLDSRKKWENDLNTGLKYLGLTVEESRTEPFMNACASFDTTLSSAIYSAWGTIRAELLPSVGPTNIVVLGKDDDVLNDKADRLKKFLNHYLTIMDKAYYSDCDVNFLWTVFCGNGFKKVWQDPILCQPLSRNIPPMDIIIDTNCTSLLTSTRITQKFKLTRQEILLKEEMKEFVDVNLRDVNDLNEVSAAKRGIDRIDGISKDSTENKSTFEYYECHTTRFIDGVQNSNIPRADEFPLPYIVTIDIINRKVVKIVRNWKENDSKFKRKECFIHQKYLPGFGLYGYGILHLLGSNSIVLTKILRQGIDAGTYANFPGFVKVKGLKTEQNDKLIGPGEAVEIETGGAVRIQDAIMPLPYKGADPTLMALRKELREESKQPAGVAETQISDKHTDAAVGTILALIEKATVVQSSVMRCMHNSMTQELGLIYACFKEYMGDEPFEFSIKGELISISKEDFDESLQIVPVSDADMDTFNQRMIKAYGLLQIAQSNPGLHDMREIYHRIYKSMNIQDIDKILMPEKDAIPLDPITENMNSIQGKPLKAAPWQDHQAHITVHMSSPNAQNPDIQAHIQEHVSFMYLMQMQQLMGMDLPPLEQLANDPELQNQIAMMATQAAAQMKQQKEDQEALTPEKVMAMDIAQREEAAKLKHEEVKLKVEADSAKAAMQFQAEMAKIKSEEELQASRNEKDLTIAEMKNDQGYGLSAIKSVMELAKHKDVL